MRAARGLFAATLIACLLPAGAAGTLAGEPAQPKPKTPQKKTGEAVPSRPTGVKLEAGLGGYGVTAAETISERVNELGQTVYEVKAAHFDISPPLTEMAAAWSASQLEADEEESEGVPRIPAARIPRSNVPDPVAQAVVPGTSSLTGGSPTAPVTGFNFIGVGINGGSPSDSNGSVGTTQFVETVNTRYQVWTLNRTTMTATVALGPVAINTLWAGFGGQCETQNAGDPIVLYDKTANRWLISQFSNNFQCVAISTTPSATGTYARYAFPMPAGL